MCEPKPEVHAVAVEVAAGAVAVRGRTGVGVAGKDLRITQGAAGGQGVVIAAWRSDQGADVPRDLRGLGDPGDHPVHVAAVDGLAGDRSADQRAGGTGRTIDPADTNTHHNWSTTDTELSIGR
jgi:hypothetical protein